MTDQMLVYAIAGLIAATGLCYVLARKFDPFAPLWMFAVGYLHVYVIQAIAYRDYAIRARGLDLVTQANGRALWALAWFLLVYHCGLPRKLAQQLPRAPVAWSEPLVMAISPVMFLWGLACAGIALYSTASAALSPEENLLRQFPIMMLVSGVLLIVTGTNRARPHLTAAGLAIAGAYVMIWMFNAKRSHALIGLLVGLCAFYVARQKRPSLPVLLATAVSGTLVVALAIGWRNNSHYEHNISGFASYLGDFELASVPAALHLQGARSGGLEADDFISYETEEYGGFLLMLDTVPSRAEYDYGESYMRLISTYIPRFLWPDKPFYGRDKWIRAWIAGSEFPRDTNFTGPAIGVLGATQLNGGAWGTVIVLGIVALLVRTAYEYYRLYSFAPWAQVWWALTYYNAWLMTVNDDPFVWFYYIYGHTILPPMVFLWVFHRATGGPCQWDPVAQSSGQAENAGSGQVAHVA